MTLNELMKLWISSTRTLNDTFLFGRISGLNVPRLKEEYLHFEQSNTISPVLVRARYNDLTVNIPDFDKLQDSQKLSTWQWHCNAIYDIHSDDFERMYTAFVKDYNPIENYDRYEDTTIEIENGEITSTVGTDNVTTTDKATTYDSQSEKVTGSVTTVGSGRTDITGEHTNTNTTTSHIHGNIGMTRTQEMINDEISMRSKHNFIIKMFDLVIGELCVRLDGGVECL